MRRRDRLARIAGGRRADLVAALGLSAFLLIYLIVQGMLHGANNLLETGCGIGVFGCVIMRRNHPQRAAVVAGGGLAGAGGGAASASPGASSCGATIPSGRLSWRAAAWR